MKKDIYRQPSEDVKKIIRTAEDAAETGPVEVSNSTSLTCNFSWNQKYLTDSVEDF
jgi:hypothetical protein